MKLLEVNCEHTRMTRTSELVPNEKNAQRHPPEQIRLLAKNIECFGWRHPIVVSNQSGMIVAGHARWEAAKLLGAAEVPVDYQSFESEAAELAVLVADNRLGALAEIDLPALADLLGEIDMSGLDIELSAYTASAFEQLQAVVFGGLPIVEDEVPDLPAEAITKPGDLWLLGEHRLLCADATNTSDVERLMGGSIADMIFTDPPYGVDYVGKTKEALTIQNDNLGFEGTRRLVADALAAVLVWLAPGAPFYICSPAGDMEMAFRLALIDAGLQLRQQLVWVKNAFVLGRQDYHWRHEAILYGWKDGAAHLYSGGRTQDTVWEIDRPSRSIEHSTMKPVALVARAIENSSRPGALVLDPFLGSGTTLIASEQLGRTCFGLDVDERYCDCVVTRWQNLTGKKAVLDD